MATEPAHRLFTVDDYHRMAEAGILTEDDRVELIDGEIVEMTPIGSPHAGCVNRLTRLCLARLGPSVVIAVQNPVVLDDLTEPQPDLTVARPRADDYSTAHPRPSDVFALIEVAENSIDPDRTRKIPRYGRAGVQEVWLVDLEAGRIETYRKSSADGFAETSVATQTDNVSFAAFPKIAFSVEEILGPLGDAYIQQT